MIIALFLFLNGIAAQETTEQKLDKLLAGQELQQTVEFPSTLASNEISWYQDIISKIAESDQTLVAGLESIVLEVQSVELIIQADYGFNKTLNELEEENKHLNKSKQRLQLSVSANSCSFWLILGPLESATL